MTLLEYQTHAKRTEGKYAHVPVSESFTLQDWRIQHACEGLATEVGELIVADSRVNLMEELGDLCWYAAIGLDAVGVMTSLWTDSDNPPDRRGPGDGLRSWSRSSIKSYTTTKYRELIKIILAGDSGYRGCLDLWKRRKFYGLKSNESITALQNAFDGILWNVHLIAMGNAFTLQQVLESNVRKLKKRYDKEFTQSEAVKRDLKAEEGAMLI